MLTALERRMFDFIRDYAMEHDRAPSLRVLGEAVGVGSKGTVHRYVQSLIRKGYLETTGPGWHNLRLAGQANGELVLPLLGRIAAGQPIEAIPGKDTVNVSELLGGDARFMLEVVGDSMVEVGIFDGDLVIVRRQDTADDGDIVVALIDNQEATLKRLRRCKNGQILLIPENTTMSAMEYDATRVQIQGVLVAQIRTFR